MASQTDTPPGFERAYARESHELLLERLRVTLTVGAVLYSAFWLLDLFVVPDQAARFLVIRLTVVALGLLIIWSTYTKWGKKLLLPLSVFMMVVASLGISAMTMYLGGFSSNYYIGNLMVLFVIGLYMPWSLRVTVWFCVLLCGGFFALNLAAHGPSVEMGSAVFFLLGTSVLTCLATVITDRHRRRDLALRLELEEANDELKELDEAKMRFFTAVSHELRTPLMLLFGPIETLALDETDKNRGELLVSMETNARRLLRQVNALLEIAKLEAGRLSLELETSNIGELLAELVAASAPHAERKGVLVETQGFEDLPEFPFDYDKVEMIAANLISNALKFTPRGGRITIRAARINGHVAFEVQDTGPGIPEDQLEQIFDRFHQVDSSLSREHEGTGLGLSLARELTRLHDGEITVRSRIGRGSIFQVELPVDPGEGRPERRRQPRRREDRLARARSEVLTAREYASRARRDTLLADVDLPRLAEVPEEFEKPSFDAPVILLLEDNLNMRSFLARRLSRLYEVRTAEDGIAGLESARKSKPDLIVSDIMMPRMDGHEFCRRLRADPAFANTPIILVTAKTGEEAVVEGLEVGADDYVIKPFALRELEARIAAQLRAKENERKLHERESRLAAIGQMTSSVVHDLRNPLTLVKGYAELAHSLAVRGEDSTMIAKEVKKLKEAAERLRRMIEEILDFARSGVSELALSSVFAAQFLDQTFRSFASDLAQQGIITKIDLRLSNEQQVTLDQDRVKRILENLMTNAREAVMNTRGERRIFVSGETSEEFLLIRVADTGPGIPEEIVDQLFEPFATRGKKRGTGLGLATVRNLARAHGGRVSVESQAPEGGAAFSVWIPLEQSVQPVEVADLARPKIESLR